MKIIIEDKEYIITNDVIRDVINLLEKIGFHIFDEKLPTVVQVGLEGLARNELYIKEKKEPDKKALFRPAKRESFVKHLSSLMKEDILKDIEKSGEDQVFGVRINANNEIVAIEFKDPSQGGGSMVAGRDIGKRKDNGREVFG